MSEIQKTLATATEVEPSKRKNEEITSQDYMKRLAVAVGELSDDEWAKLPAAAQDWYNNAADALKLGKVIEVYPDMAPAAGTRRRGTAEAKPWAPSVGAVVNITTKRGKAFTGVKIAELDDNGLVLEDGTELDHDKIASIESAGGVEAQGSAEPEAPAEPAEGDTVEVETARGKKIIGNITVIDGDDLIVKDATGEEHELTKSKLKSIVVRVPASAGGRSGKAETKPAAKAETKPTDEKPKRVTASANGGVSATQRMRELICADLAADKAAITAALKKEGLEFKQATLDLIYADSHKLIQILRDLKKVK